MTPEREAEVKKLAEVDVHIADAERAVTEQTAQVEAVRVTGHDTAMAERELTAFRETLDVLQDPRAVIIKIIEQIDAGMA